MKILSPIQLILTLVLTAGTAGIFGMYDWYETNGDEVIENPEFSEEFKGWTQAPTGVSLSSHDPQAMQLNSPDGSKATFIRQTVRKQQGHQAFRFSGSMKTEGIVQGPKTWQVARLMLVGLDPSGQPKYDSPHILAARSGTNDWEDFSQVFKFTDETPDLLIEFQLPRVKGTAWARNLSLEPVAIQRGYNTYRFIAIVFWGVLILWIAFPHLRNGGYSVQQLLVAVIVAVILTGVLMPEQYKLGLAESFSSADHFFTLSHFLGFTLLSIAVLWPKMSGHIRLQRLGLLVLFAMVTEILQLLTNERHPQIEDFLADLAGIITVFFLRLVLSSKLGQPTVRQ